MVKASPRDIPAHLKALDAKIRAVLVFGKDDGLIRERRDTLTRQIVPDKGDPFSLSMLSPDQVRDDPALIADEMGAVSMTGGRRLVRLDDAGDKELDSIKNALSHQTGDTLLLVTSGDLSPRSKLRAFFEKETGVLSMACYADSAESLGAMIADMFRTHNIQAPPEVIAYLKENLGSDRLVTRAELDKIIFYLGAEKGDIGPPKHLTLEDARALTSESSQMTLFDIATATTGSDPKRLAGYLDKAISEGVGAIEILRMVQMRLQNLNLVRGLVDEGKPINEALKVLRPPVFFKDRDIFVAQVRAWPAKRLLSALDYTVRAEAACKKTGAPDFSIAAKACQDICAISTKHQLNQ